MVNEIPSQNKSLAMHNTSIVLMSIDQLTGRITKLERNIDKVNQSISMMEQTIETINQNIYNLTQMMLDIKTINCRNMTFNKIPSYFVADISNISTGIKGSFHRRVLRSIYNKFFDTKEAVNNLKKIINEYKPKVFNPMKALELIYKRLI